jgi:hypothetical protein
MIQLMAVVFCAWAALGQSGCGSRTTVVSSGGDEDANTSAGGTDRGDRGKGKLARGQGRKDASVEEDRTAPAFAYPGDQAGKMLAELLPPHRQEIASSAYLLTSPRRPAPDLALDRPELSLPPNLADLPEPKVETPAQPLRPHMVAAEPPLEWARSQPSAPARQELPAAARVRLDTPRFHESLALPAVVQYAADRGSLADPTGDLSRVIALFAVPPARTTPAPFVRMDLPDPFERKKEVKLTKPPDESKVPLGVGTSAPPK